MSSLILDASALLAILAQEPRAARWGGSIRDAFLSAVNLSEVVAKLADFGMRESEIRAMIEPLGLSIVPFDVTLAYESGLLRPLTKGVGLSFGDRACLALAARMNHPALTTDRAWAKLDIGVEIATMA